MFAGRYAFVDLLGSGGMGTVWRVWDAKRGVYCAAKVLNRADSTSLLRFIRETSWRVDHAHVLTPTGWAAEDDQVLFTMPLLRGGTVAELVRDFGALPDTMAEDLLRQLLEALSAVHGAGLVHRDVKPSNLLLDPPGTAAPRLHLSDFGIAARIDDPRLTRIGEAVGTRGYTAPEVLTGADPDPAQDMYAAGVVAVELLTGDRPGREGGLALGGLTGRRLRPLVLSMVSARLEDRPTAGAALEALRALPAPASPPEDEDAEVFDQVPPLPEGWGPDGPEDRVVDRAEKATAPSSAARGPARTMTSPTDPTPPAARTTAFAVPDALAAPRERGDATEAAGDVRRRPRPLLPLLAVILVLAGAAAIAGGFALLR